MSWNLGNTTVRNPGRIRDGLIFFEREFNGNADGKVRERQLWERLAEEGLVSSQETRDPDQNGRKWRSVFTKMGFVSIKKYTAQLADLNLGFTGRPYEITPIGYQLIRATNLEAIQDVFLRQLLRVETLSPIEKGKYEKIKPLVLVLQILERLGSQNQDGVNKQEIAAFVQTAKSHNIDEIVGKINRYRQQRGTYLNKTEKMRFDKVTIEQQRSNSKPRHPKIESLIDYADTTIRYCRMTGLFSLKGTRLVISDEKKATVEEILRNEPDFLAEEAPIEYLIDFYKGTQIPTDTEFGAIQDIMSFESKIKEQGLTPIVIAREIKDRSSQNLTNLRYEIANQYYTIQEQIFAHRHFNDETCMDEVITYLVEVSKKKPNPELAIDDKVSYLEWAVWRALLTLNSLATGPDKTRNFKLDKDLRPIAHARSGVPDIIMIYNDFVLVVEATLTTGTRQLTAENESVRRHVVDAMINQDPKLVYGLFVAPEIDFNTADTFHQGRWYDTLGYRYNVEIVPINIQQLIKIVECTKTARRNPNDLQKLLLACLQDRHSTDVHGWLEQINNKILEWI
jgi:hypothetical protein